MSKIRVALAMLALALGAVSAEAQGYVLVVNAANPVTSITKDRANGLFLKRITRWENGSPVVPVNLDRGSATRETRVPAAAATASWSIGLPSCSSAPPARSASAPQKAPQRSSRCGSSAAWASSRARAPGSSATSICAGAGNASIGAKG